MTHNSPDQTAVELLQQLGLKEYEAKSFVALTQLPSGTARSVSEQVDVPRTRVYEAMRTLEEMGLVQIQHSTPQEFQAIPINEATTLLRKRYEQRIEELETNLARLEAEEPENQQTELQKVWSLSGTEAITTRTQELIDEATGEIVFVIGDDRIYSAELFDHLKQASDRGVAVYVGSLTEDVETAVEDYLPEARTFTTALEWLQGPTDDEEAAIGRLLLVDEANLLASSIQDDDGGGIKELGVFGRGFENGLVVIMRRLFASGLEEAGFVDEN
ncbi:MAG: TrmB family transcriptional regulator [Halobacteriales archaeon]